MSRTRRFGSSGDRAPRGFSLVEVLVVVAIIAIVAGVLVARRRGFLAQDASNMRQFGLAEALYVESHDGRRPLDLGPLVSERLLLAEMCASAMDSTAIGLGNVQIVEMGRFVGGARWSDGRVTPFRQSYFSLRGSGLENKLPLDDPEASNVGWIVSLVETDAVQLDRPNILFEVGPYYRLCLDGSLVRRRMENTGFGEVGQRAWFLELIFWDGSEEWVRNRN
ncbi:MAG: prepilin-type N-terminal cleavage/methylation domain-containing protein [Fimbriimonadaceae bacterium]|nr:prepilin-type N-terminal cleavage/methylation domain-containing protein [Fimbriimonadaceae bacterium]